MGCFEGEKGVHGQINVESHVYLILLGESQSPSFIIKKFEKKMQ